MSAPLLDGSDVFGLGTKVKGPTAMERRAQNTAYPGLNGIESLDLGDAGMMTEVYGRLFGNNPAALAAAFASLNSFRDGNGHQFTDSDGTVWPDVKLLTVDRTGDKVRSPDGCSQTYCAKLFHLTTL